MKPKTILPLLACLFATLTITQAASAQTMENNESTLRLEEVDDTFSLTPTVTPLPTKRVTLPEAQKTVPQNNFHPPIDISRSLSLSLSTSVLDFGLLSPTSPTIRTLTATLTGSTSDVILYTMHNRNLTTQNDLTIPETSCDNGACSKGVASVWNSTLSFGLGYSCEGRSCDVDFSKEAYRPFSSNLTSFAQDMLGTGNKRVLELPLKINVPGTQESGRYENTIVIFAIPSL